MLLLARVAVDVRPHVVTHGRKLVACRRAGARHRHFGVYRAAVARVVWSRRTAGRWPVCQPAYVLAQQPAPVWICSTSSYSIPITCWRARSTIASWPTAPRSWNTRRRSASLRWPSSALRSGAAATVRGQAGCFSPWGLPPCPSVRSFTSPASTPTSRARGRYFGTCRWSTPPAHRHVFQSSRPWVSPSCWPVPWRRWGGAFPNIDALWPRRLGVMLVLELAPAPRTLYSASIPSIYTTIAADPRPVRVLQLPFGVRDGTFTVGNFSARDLLYQTEHGKRLIGGYLSRISRKRVDAVRAQPTLDALVILSEGGTLSPPHAAWIRSRGPQFIERANVGYVVVDQRRTPPHLRDVRHRRVDARGDWTRWGVDAVSTARTKVGWWAGCDRVRPGAARCGRVRLGAAGCVRPLRRDASAIMPLNA